MIYDLTAVRAGLKGLIGWRQPLETEFAIMTSPNTDTSTGLYYQGFNKLVTVAGLRHAFPESLINVDFNTKISEMEDDAIARVILDMIQKKKPQVKDLLQKFWLFDKANVMDDLADNTAGNWVGYEITPGKHHNLQIVIDRIISSFSAVATFNIQLYHSSQKAAVATKEITTVANDDSFSAVTDFIMPYIRAGKSVGGTWYVGYLQDDLGATQAQSRSFEDSDVQNFTQWAGIRPIVVEGFAGGDIFDIADVKDSNSTHGLNFEISMKSDFTAFFIEQKDSWANCIGHQVAIDSLQVMLNSTRNNETKKENRQSILIELKGTDERPHLGLEWKLAKAYKELNFDMSAIDPLLLPPRDRFSFAGL